MNPATLPTEARFDVKDEEPHFVGYSAINHYYVQLKKRTYAKIEPHRARSVTYAILRNYYFYYSS